MQGHSGMVSLVNVRSGAAMRVMVRCGKGYTARCVTAK